MVTNSDVSIDFFDLETVSTEEQNEFLEDMGEVVMQKILLRAWAELATAKRDELTELLEASEADPESSEKQDAVLLFLDEHIPTIRDIVSDEVADIQNTYREYRDEILDTVA